MAEVIAALTALPAYLLFHLTWLIHSRRRPLLLVSLLCLLSNPSAAITGFDPNLPLPAYLAPLPESDPQWASLNSSAYGK